MLTEQVKAPQARTGTEEIELTNHTTSNLKPKRASCTACSIKEQLTSHTSQQQRRHESFHLRQQKLEQL